MYKKFGKRLLDIILSIVGLALLSPVLLCAAALVRIKLGSPVIFRQRRPGLNGKIFKLRKFRSMTDQKDSNGNPLPDAERLTGFGRLLRSTSLDELPELFNILKGDMSIVGPRPLLVQYLPLYSPEQMRRHDVRPGLTGYAQINGRNEISWKEKFELDCFYVDNMSLSFDIKIILSTFLKTISRSGVSSETSVTMEPFKGNDDNFNHPNT